MIHLKQAVVVEGKYDKIRLDSLIDAVIIETNGFRIFKDPDKVALLRELAERTGIVVLTDSDAAGFKIRNYIRSTVRTGQVYHAYIPEILGKERRKAQPSKEGTLGVEGMEAEILLAALDRAGIGADDVPRARRITKADFFADGLTGREGSAARRLALLARLGLPKYLSTNSLLELFNSLYTYEEYRELLGEL